MAEMNMNEAPRRRRFRAHHRGRFEQIGIYFGKLLRMFVYQNDWKVLPMAALIASLVGMVIRRKCFVTMEGTVMGAFAMVCVCIWNGCFNSIQVICRERDVIKREHRSGMHISSYIFSHMLYQLILCVLQTGVTLYVTSIVGVQYNLGTPIVTPLFIVDFGISMLLITFSSDMLSLWVSTLARSTTTAMTIMPFVLIFQLVFSGGMLTLPAWTKPMTNFTISNPGLKVIAAQADVNNKPYSTIPDMVAKMKDNEIGGTIRVSELLDRLSNADSEFVAEVRAYTIGRRFTVGELRSMMDSDGLSSLRDRELLTDLTAGDVITWLKTSPDAESLRGLSLGVPGVTVNTALNALSEKPELMEKKLLKRITVGDLIAALDDAGVWEKYKDVEINASTTIGAVVDWLSNTPEMQALRDKELTFNTTVGQLLEAVGEEDVKEFLAKKASEANRKAEYEYTQDNVLRYWGHLILFAVAFSMLATITLEFIDKDKR